MQKGITKRQRRYETIVKGVYFYPGKSAKPYQVIVNWPSVHFERFATKEEALDCRAKDVQKQVAKSIERANTKKSRTEAERTFVTQKRAADLETHGATSKQERDVADAFARLWTELTGFVAIVLNDFTRADILLAIDAEALLFVRVQIKTANKRRRNDGAKQWEFAQVKGYTGMPVVFWAVDACIGWLHDGKDLEVGKSDHLTITHNGIDAERTSNEKEWNGRCVFDMKGLLETIRSEKDRWPLVTEESARWDFKSRKHFVEMLTLETYRRKYPETYDFPVEQGGRSDLVGKPLAEGGNGLRVQHKSARESPGYQTGVLVEMVVSAGHDDDGKKLNEPYESSDFDELVVMYHVPRTWKALVWEIPMAVLIEKGIVGHELFKGITGFYLHATDDITGKPRDCNQSVWTRDFYKGMWDLPEKTEVILNACKKHSTAFSRL